MSHVKELITDCYVVNLGKNLYLNINGMPSSFGLETKLFDSENEAHEWMNNNWTDSKISSYRVQKYYVNFVFISSTEEHDC